MNDREKWRERVRDIRANGITWWWWWWWLIGLGFDGASVMRGQLSGVQKRIRDNTPYAYYVHCYRHRQNLVLINATKHILSAADFLSLLENLYILISNPVIHEKFLGIQWEMFSNQQVRELQHLSDTRWLCLVFVAASHQTRLDTRSKARRPIKVGIKGRGRSGTSRDSNPACLCCSSAHLVQCEPDEASSFTNPNVGPGTYAS